jgi:hypothetical protein
MGIFQALKPARNLVSGILLLAPVIKAQQYAQSREKFFTKELAHAGRALRKRNQERGGRMGEGT